MRDDANPDQISLFDTLQNRDIRETVIKSCHMYDSIISVDNLLISWKEFLKGKRKRKDIAEFSLHFMDNIFSLNEELIKKTYKHGPYLSFEITDPKQRSIHKAPVRDRLMHHAIHRILYPYFDRKFIYDSYSCRNRKGTHKAMDRFHCFTRKTSQNNTKTAWVLKGDIRKFFASIDHQILKNILRHHVNDENVLWLTNQIIDSFHSDNRVDVGLPLGNLTSQLLVNIYMNEFDHFVKRKLKIRFYIRYADDFVIIHESREFLVSLIPVIAEFLKNKLNLSLHPNKVFIKTIYSGIDFLGWVHFPHHRVMRTTTKRRVLKKLQIKHSRETLASYSGLLSHGNTYKIVKKIQKQLLNIHDFSI